MSQLLPAFSPPVGVHQVAVFAWQLLPFRRANKTAALIFCQDVEDPPWAAFQRQQLFGKIRICTNRKAERVQHMVRVCVRVCVCVRACARVKPQ